ncbi:hypothetical protein Lser_V15G03589 [Lactuca serriola]
MTISFNADLTTDFLFTSGYEFYRIQAPLPLSDLFINPQAMLILIVATDLRTIGYEIENIGALVNLLEAIGDKKDYNSLAQIFVAMMSYLRILFKQKKQITGCHPWICENGVAPDRALDHAILSSLKQFPAMNKLKKMDLRVIVESLSEEEIAGLREMFKSMDTKIRDLMDAADVDNNGTIDYGEFVKVYYVLSASSYLQKFLQFMNFSQLYIFKCEGGDASK